MTKCQNDMADDHDKGGSDESSDLFYWGLFFFLDGPVLVLGGRRQVQSEEQSKREGRGIVGWFGQVLKF